MADNDMNMIKPVDNLPNVASAAPAKDRRERKKKQQAFDGERTDYHEWNDADQEVEDSATADDGQQHAIDYRA